jgi:hypothetical protein
MASLIDTVDSEKNTTMYSSNVELNVLVYKDFDTFAWSYNYNGADYSGVTLNIYNYGNFVNILSFSDNRAILHIGNTNINITKQQAIADAEAYVRNTYLSTEFCKRYNHFHPQLQRK